MIVAIWDYAGDAKQEVDEAYFVLCSAFAGEAVTTSDHAHDLEALNGCRGRLPRLEPSGGTDYLLESSVVRFDDVVQVL